MSQRSNPRKLHGPEAKVTPHDRGPGQLISRNNDDAGPQYINHEHTENGRLYTALNTKGYVVTIETGDQVDLRIAGLVNRACILTEHFQASKIVVDLAETTQLLDSGLAMLLMMINSVGKHVEEITLENAGRAVQRRINSVRLPTLCGDAWDVVVE